MKLNSKYLLVVVLILMSFQVAAQNGMSKVQLINRGNYQYVPCEAREDSVFAIMFNGPTVKSYLQDSVCFELYWISNCNDGYYNLLITPEQIWFTSTHDNPNPNYLIWVMDIDTSTYYKIKKGLSLPPAGFACYNQNKTFKVYCDTAFQKMVDVPDDWNDSIMMVFDVKCQQERKCQLEHFRTILLQFMDGQELAWPDNLAMPKLMARSDMELMYYMPVMKE